MADLLMPTTTARPLDYDPEVIDPNVDEDVQTEEEMQARLSSLVGMLEALAKDQVQRKAADVEQRWLGDLRAFHGRYDQKTETELAGTSKSRAYVKITRKKTNSWEARLSALLFPTDDDNWDIRPTPVPTLVEQAKQAVEQAKQALAQANDAASQMATSPDPAQQQQLAQQAETLAATAQEALDDAAVLQLAVDEAKKRSEAMRGEMRDQLVECDYASHCRMVIRDCVRLGSGILKGPLSGGQRSGKWLQIDGSYQYKREEDPAPVYRWVDPWSYFPDMSAMRPEDREFEFERHLWSGKDLRGLVREAGFNKTAVRAILEERTNRGHAVTDTSMNYLVDLRSITGAADAIKDRFVGWEYHGPLGCREIATVLRALGDDAGATAYEERDDPLEEIRVIVWFAEGRILKMAPAYPLDSGESLYSMFTFEPSEGSIFGYGVPNIMGDSQKSMNGAWRMALDNAGLSVGPQIFIDRDAVEPANRSWDLTPRKIWYKKKGATLGAGNVLEIQNIPNNVEEIMNIVRTARQFIDDETALPVQAEGELTDNPNITATATNFMSMASNITFRRVVKNFDDGLTVPSIRRLYDWNMQHNSRDDIKGDMKVDARGSGALLQRELQAQMLLNIAQNWSSHPRLKHALKGYGYDAIVDTLRAAMIQPETIMPSREEFIAAIEAEDKAMADQAAKASETDPTVISANVRRDAAQIDADSRLQVAEMQRETEMMKLAQQYDIKLEALHAMLNAKDMEIGHKERALAVEVAVEKEREERAAARGQTAPGSGGSI